MDFSLSEAYIAISASHDYLLGEDVEGTVEPALVAPRGESALSPLECEQSTVNFRGP